MSHRGMRNRRWYQERRLARIGRWLDTHRGDVHWQHMMTHWLDAYDRSRPMRVYTDKVFEARKSAWDRYRKLMELQERMSTE